MKNFFSIFKNLTADSKPSDIIDRRISYKFQSGLERFQEELDIEQDHKLMELVTSVDTENISLESSIGNVLKILSESIILVKFLQIILKGKDECSQESEAEMYHKLKNSELHKILTDFFSLNPTVMGWLKTIGGALTSMPTIPSTSNS